MLWVVFAALTGVAVLAFLWPLLRAPRGSEADSPDKAFYLSAIAGIDRDLGRGLISAEDAESARAEAARRFIAAAKLATPATLSRTRARAAALAGLVLIPALSFGLYFVLGAPEYPDQPLEARRNAPPDPNDINAMLAKVEQHLQANPDDDRGWEIVASVYMKMGKPTQAAEAYRQIVRLRGPTAENLSAFGEALAFAANGQITPQARAAFEAALKDDETHPRARFFVALADEQAGEKDKAVAAYQKLLADAPPDAPWAEVVRERIARLGAVPNGPAAAIAAAPEAQREQMIRGMVVGLAARLAANGGGVGEWSQLVRAYTVLKEPAKAREALADAKKALDGDAVAIDQLDALSRELGLGG